VHFLGNITGHVLKVKVKFILEQAAMVQREVDI
jgi:hypothetical protein